MLFFRTCVKLVVMLVDVRNRTSNAPVKIPCKYKAYLFRFFLLEENVFRVIIAESKTHAFQYMKDWCYRENVDIFYTFEGELDYEIAGVCGDDYFSNLLFPE